jgi:hypothetical protein
MGYLTKWLFFTLQFAAAPYVIVVVLNRVLWPESPLLHPSSEVLFIAVIATSSALGELWDGEDHARVPRSPSRIKWQLMMLFGVLASSVLYGAFVYHTLENPGRAHGIDCSVVAEWSSGARAAPVDPLRSQLIRRWGAACTGWATVQATLFTWSLWMAGVLAVLSTAVVYVYPPRRP